MGLGPPACDECKCVLVDSLCPDVILGLKSFCPGCERYEEDYPSYFGLWTMDDGFKNPDPYYNNARKLLKERNDRLRSLNESGCLLESSQEVLEHKA